MEETLWKSRLQWIKEGDNNKFFHWSTTIRRRKNKILALKDSSGNWFFEHEHITNHISSHFKNLYTSTHLQSPLLSPSEFHPLRIPDNQSSDLVKTFSEDEIYSSLMSFKPFKAPGPDGLPPFFFSKFWSCTKSAVISTIQTVYQTKKWPEGLNETFITLVSRCADPESINSYRPSVYVILSIS